MDFDVAKLDYSLLIPEFILLGTVFLAWTVDLMVPRRARQVVAWVSIAGALAAIAAAVAQWGTRASFAGVLRIDEFSTFFRILFLLSAIGVTLLSMDYASRFLTQAGEYYGLILTGTLGMIVMAEANELLTAYLGLELLSFSSYVLVSYAKTSLKSNEAGMKYIILGAFSSALLLYGISLLYGSLGTTYLPDVAKSIGRLSDISAGLGVALALITAGLGFKVAAVPFHMWTPDVYEGAPTPVTAYLSVSSKAAGFALVMRVLVGGLLPLQDQYQAAFALLALLTMTLGNLVAIQQRNLKRLLAYSSIGQAGYVLLGAAAFTSNVEIAEQAARGMMLHLAGYVATNLAAFGALIAFQNLNEGRELISDMAGFARRAPLAGLAMMTALFSAAGMPLFAGFVTKFYLFAAASRAGLIWLVAIAVVNSTISLYYYLLVLYQMYVREPPGYEAADGHGHVDRHLAPAVALVAPVAVRASVAGPSVLSIERGQGSGAPASTADGVGSHDGHAHHEAFTDGHAVPNGHDGLAAPPSGPWWSRDITMDMPKERFFPQYRVPWVTSLALLLFMAGVFYVGLYPRDLIDLLRSASSALFSS